VIGKATIPISPHSAEEWYTLKNNSIDTDIKVSLFQKHSLLAANLFLPLPSTTPLQVALYSFKKQ
jgi:hypothetical protein